MIETLKRKVRKGWPSKYKKGDQEILPFCRIIKQKKKYIRIKKEEYRIGGGRGGIVIKSLQVSKWK